MIRGWDIYKKPAHRKENNSVMKNTPVYWETVGS
jgi:hypothetical protein